MECGTTRSYRVSMNDLIHAGTPPAAPYPDRAPRAEGGGAGRAWYSGFVCKHFLISMARQERLEAERGARHVAETAQQEAVATATELTARNERLQSSLDLANAQIEDVRRRSRACGQSVGRAGAGGGRAVGA